MSQFFEFWSLGDDKGMENHLNWTENTNKVVLEHKKHILMLKWDIWEWFCGIGYQELTKTSYFGDSDLYEGCMVVKSGGSNRQFNLLQNEYHIELITYFQFKNWKKRWSFNDICDASLNFQWATSMNI